MKCWRTQALYQACSLQLYCQLVTITCFESTGVKSTLLKFGGFNGVGHYFAGVVRLRVPLDLSMPEITLKSPSRVTL